MSFRNRILAVMTGLLAVALLASAAASLVVSRRSALVQAEENLEIGQRVVGELLDGRGERLRNAVDVLTADFGFREAVATRERATIESTLANHGGRIGANLVVLTDLDRRVVASSEPETPAFQDDLRRVLARTVGSNQASSTGVIDGVPYQFVVVPVRAPLPIGLVTVGFSLDDAFVEEVRSLVGLDASLFGGGDLLATTLPDEAAQASIGPADAAASGYLSRSFPVGAGDSGAQPQLVLHRSLVSALAPYRALSVWLLGITVIALATSLAMAVALGRGIARPIQRLAKVARSIGEGDYEAPLEERGHDEIGDLARSINAMRSDISEREQRILHQASHDALTDLANRTALPSLLRAHLARAERSSSSVALVSLDIARLKDINDTFGEETGDEVIVAVAERLRGTVRRSDSVARVGGDEMALVLESADPAVALGVVEKLRRDLALRPPLGDDGPPVDLAAGIAVFPDHAEEADALMRCSETALRQAKRIGSEVTVYEASEDEKRRRQIEIVHRLRTSLETGAGFKLVYQPIVRSRDASLHHVEALVRWIDDELGFVGPDEFVPLAERAGLVRRLTQWVLGEATRQAAEWRAAGHRIDLAVNLSAIDLQDGELPVAVGTLLTDRGVEAGALAFEVTESALMEDSDVPLSVLEQLRGLGLSLAIDDFGTGFSSLARLKKLPVQQIKIDRTFVMRLDSDADDQAIVQSTITLAKSLGLETVAEGVENEEAFEWLMRAGCDYLQGYGISKPVPADELIEWLEERTAGSASGSVAEAG